MNDETYQKYLGIAYRWSERKKTNRGVRIYSERHEIYTSDNFYVLGIGVSNFLEPKGYKAEDDLVNDPSLNTDLDYNPKELIKYMCGNSKISIDDLYELSEELKAAGAKEVYLHPSFWTDGKALLDHYISDEWLVVIPKN